MNRKPVRTLPSAILIVLMLVLLSTSCGERDTPDQLRAQIDTIHRSTPTTAPVVQLTGDFVPYAYAVADDDQEVTPFGRPAAVAIATDANERPGQRGEKQALEDVPLESIRMVGTLSRDGRTDALLQVDKVVYPSRAGDYVGQNFGVIRHIADRHIELEELIRAGADWEKRMTTLELQGSGK